MKLICHIGVHKTGTSALQAFLHQNHEVLRDRGVWYEPVAGHTNHTPIAQALQKPGSPGPRLITANLEAAHKHGCGLCLLSSEAFVEHPFEIGEFTSVVKGIDVTVIAYMRRSDEIILSAHNELVRSLGWTTTVAERMPYDPTYRDLLFHWLGERPWRLMLAPYDQAQWPNGSIFDDFLAMLGIESAGFDTAVQVEAANRSLPPALLEVLRISNRLDLAPEKRKAFIAGLFEAWDLHPDWYRAGSLLSDDDRAALQDKLRERIHIFRPYFREGFDETFLFSEGSSASDRKVEAVIG